MQTDPTPAPVTAPADRRSFLRLGAGAVVGAAALAACGTIEESPPAETGDKPLESETTLAPPQTTAPEVGATTDAAVVRTGRSLELAAVEIYSVFLGGEVQVGEGDPVALPQQITLDAEVTEAFEFLSTLHESHAEAMIPLISAADGNPVTEPNVGFLQNLLRVNIGSLTSQGRILEVAAQVEAMIAATLGWGAGVVSTADQSQAIMEIGAVSARQSTATALLIEPSGVGLVPAATLDVSGPARIPDFMILTEDMDGGDAFTSSQEAATAASDAETDAEAAAEGN